MATLDDVRRIALALPGTVEAVDGHRGGAVWRLRSGAYVWERGPSGKDLADLEGLGRSWPAGPVIGVRADGPEGKDELLTAYPDAFFTIPHFDGYPAVLGALDRIDEELLGEVITDAWLLRAPKRDASAWLAEHGVDGSD